MAVFPPECSYSSRLNRGQQDRIPGTAWVRAEWRHHPGGHGGAIVEGHARAGDSLAKRRTLPMRRMALPR